MKKETDAKRYKEPFFKTVRRHWMLLAMLAPALIYVVVFNYIPMTGIVLAFKKYQYAGGIYGSPWNGLDNFKALMISGKLGQVTRNTLLYNVAFIFLGMACEVGSAILLNELFSKRFKKVAQSFMFLPYFISWVVAGAIMYNIFNYERGVFNHIVTALGGQPFDLYNTPSAWPPVLIFLKVWKQTGYGSVVYLAALTGIDPGLYEAANIDGANRFKQIWHITVPALLPTVVLMTALNLGNILNAGFDQIFNLYNPIVYETADIIDTYVYRIGMVERQYSIGAAVGLLKSVISFALILGANKCAKKATGSGIF